MVKDIGLQIMYSEEYLEEVICTVEIITSNNYCKGFSCGKFETTSGPCLIPNAQKGPISWCLFISITETLEYFLPFREVYSAHVNLLQINPGKNIVTIYPYGPKRQMHNFGSRGIAEMAAWFYSGNMQFSHQRLTKNY